MSLIKKPAELNVQAFIKALIYGQPGLGKTTLGLSAPRPLLLDFDGGVHRVRTEHQTDTVQISSWQDVIDLLENEDLSAYQSLVIDTAGKALDFMSEYLIKNDPKLGRADGALTLQGYGSRKVLFKNFLKKVAIMKKHLVFVAHDTEEKNGDQKIVRPEIGGSSSGDLIKELDLVGYMQAIGKQRTISFDPEERYYGKNTCQLDPVIGVSELEETTPNILLSTIFDSYAKNLAKRQEKAKEYNDLIDLIAKAVDGLQNAEDANLFVIWIDNIEHIWDSKYQARRLFGKKVKELGLSFDKESGEFSDPVVEEAPEQDIVETETPETDVEAPESDGADTQVSEEDVQPEQVIEVVEAESKKATPKSVQTPSIPKATQKNLFVEELNAD
ncbi:ATP-binding protein [Pedobacter sp. SYP-B3415]|uniref:ATP-binding protein n=1 Tax=Pedobacter sp. SYP-B3415 TaxID=2496641 RepID=UPI00101DA0EA|nr:ATP-binding protein [Pedobacter sp. SYP-B3415]